MSDFALTLQGDEKIQVSGRLDFHSVPEVWEQLRPMIEQREHLDLSLAGVTHANSAALALLLEAVDLADHTGVTLHLREIPQSLRDLAELSNVWPVLSNA